jgi:UDPglucose 6-dehydrogenase
MFDSNNVAIIGTGYVGLVTGACLSEFGLNVICVDSDISKISLLNNNIIPFYEPELKQLVEKNRAAQRLSFTSDIKEAIDQSTVIFIAVGTPPQEDGSADLNYVLNAAKSIAVYMNEYKLIVIKSTVPVGTCRRVKELISDVLKERNIKVEFDIASNPEFLREGSAIRDFMHPDRVVIGYENERAKNILKDIYNVLYLIDVPFVFTNLETAEMIKYASNAFLATKISFINEIANLCDEVGADVYDVAKAMGMDGRIGKYFLHPGPGFGGSCLPKDTKALLEMGNKLGIEMKLIKSVIEVNEMQWRKLLEKMRLILKDLRDKKITVLGIAFKQNTDDIRESPAIKIINSLLNEGSYILAYDPVANSKALDLFHNNDQIKIGNSEYEVAEGADALVVLTEWNQFRHLDLKKIKSLMKNNFIFDFRNIYEPEEIKKLGFIYVGVGRK